MAWTFYNSNGEALVQHAESEATQAEMEAETAGAKFVPPDLVKNSPGVAKVWCMYEQTGAHGITDSYNVTSVTDGGGAGDTDILWATDFSTENNAFAWFCNEGEMTMGCDDTTRAAGMTKLQTMNGSSASDQTMNSIIGFGDQ